MACDFGKTGPVAKSAQTVGRTMGGDEGPLASSFSRSANARMAALRSPVQGRSWRTAPSAKHADKEGVARCLLSRRGRRQATVIDDQMAVETKPGGGRSDLALAVGLQHASRHQRVGAAVKGSLQDEIKFAELVAAEPEFGHVFALDPQTRAAEFGS